ncbi:phosphoadenylyl-sulfate reductase [Saccharibacter floricola]|uniref:Adenosine 5'-phosphosulfate reductase n=1 Tax=Saccharibacter floricola DSM 15669 TaxID=1123227 RepID=A0ABQ0NZV1_9PROT|nr:phosphoadenylyl-sulfate reductase [Saccharibacter floricola]GBQ05002.1 phosphoadenosine phosphosulfate reductase [Saccharibacter floricola DSM 15669]
MALSTQELAALREVEATGNAAQTTQHVLRYVADTLRGRVAVVSSFGAESAVLLAQVAQYDSTIPVFFLDTLRHFPETLAYRETLTQALGLRDVRVLSPQRPALEARDPHDQLADFDPDACCALRKVEPLDVVLPEFDVWITGRKRNQASTRTALPVVEPQDDGGVKLNPLAGWGRQEVLAFMESHHLPAHPLVAQGYPSIGCAPCTRAVGAGEDSRSGRWAGQAKTECGIHRPVSSPS